MGRAWGVGVSGVFYSVGSGVFGFEGGYKGVGILMSYAGSDIEMEGREGRKPSDRDRFQPQDSKRKASSSNLSERKRRRREADTYRARPLITISLAARFGAPASISALASSGFVKFEM